MEAYWLTKRFTTIPVPQVVPPPAAVTAAAEIAVLKFMFGMARSLWLDAGITIESTGAVVPNVTEVESALKMSSEHAEALGL